MRDLPTALHWHPSGDFGGPSVCFRSFPIEIDDVLVAYTDGITEAENRQHEPWGQQRLETLLKSCSRMSPKEIINAILDRVSTFARGQPQRDDVTLLVIRVEAGCDD